MSLTPEQAQAITDLRSRMLKNVAAGLPAHEGISEQEIANGLSFLRQNRTAAAAAGGKKTATKTKKAKPSVDTSAFTDMDLD